MGSPIAALAYEIYHKHNVFIVKPTSEGLRYSIALPPQSSRPLIRRLQLQVFLSQRNWDVIRRLAVGAYGFNNIRYITLYFRWPPSPKPVYYELVQEKRHVREAIRFACKGEVVFEEIEGGRRGL
jgi:hypothetical protein